MPLRSRSALWLEKTLAALAAAEKGPDEKDLRAAPVLEYWFVVQKHDGALSLGHVEHDQEDGRPRVRIKRDLVGLNIMEGWAKTAVSWHRLGDTLAVLEAERDKYSSIYWLLQDLDERMNGDPPWQRVDDSAQILETLNEFSRHLRKADMFRQSQRAPGGNSNEATPPKTKRALVTGDWHVDSWARSGIDFMSHVKDLLKDIDALIFAGDLANDPLKNWPPALARLSESIEPEKVFIIPGNHDFYQFDLAREDELHEIVDKAGMTFAQKEALQIGDTRFLCCTLWTDFALNGDADRAKSVAWGQHNDYRQISNAGRSARPDHTVALHENHLSWLNSAMAEPFAGKTVIVTHHGPSPSITGPQDAYSPSFCSNLDSWILKRKPDLWLFGHTHRHLRSRVGKTKIVNVSIGYAEDAPLKQLAELMQRGLVETGSAEPIHQMPGLNT